MPCSLISLLKLLYKALESLFHRLTITTAASDESSSNRRPWEPPFDPTRPSAPISYPITDLEALESRSYFNSFHFPFNISSVRLPADSVQIPFRPRMLVCHDMKGGYTDDIWVQGGDNEGAYAIWHWGLMDVFVYFSHYLVTIPPPCWINAAHTHGVKVLGTFITEWDEGKESCKTLLATKESAQMYADRLSELAQALGFDGWLINMEVNLDIDLIENMKEFVKHLTNSMHSAVPGSLIIWYDAITKDGKLVWQNQLNDKNKPFFDICDGIFVNYTWKENNVKKSIEIAGERRYDVYMGIDVFGRNTYGGGQWNTNVALDLLKKEQISAAIFAPGWVYETDQGPDFQTAQNRWWGLVGKSWGILQSYPKQLPFFSNFDQGHGYGVYIDGLEVYNNTWNNISSQGFQPLLISSDDQTNMEAFIDFKNSPYNGGASITVKGNLEKDSFFTTQLFNGNLPLINHSLCIFYSAKSDDESALGLCLELLNNKNELTHILITDNKFPLFTNHPKFNFETIIILSEKLNSNSNWVLYETTVNSNSQTLTKIYLVGQSSKNNDTYLASLGQLTINTTKDSFHFPSSNEWRIEAQNISISSSNDTKQISLKTIWLLNDDKNIHFPFTKYNIYVEKLGSGENMKYLGFAKVQAYYVSDLVVSSEINTVKFYVQPCAIDGSCQDLDTCPVFLLNV
ncbi:hypothetical protein LUZ60_003867 [Juncus effusus]|nr:hypothetical protein LUZ60_003867 [Juncus effusus]